MRKWFSYQWGLLLFSLVLVACNKDKREEFFVISDHVDFTIQPGLNVFDTHFYSISPKLSLLETQLDASGHTADEVKAIEARSAVLTSIFGDVNLDFIDVVSIHIFDPSDPGNKIEFFYLDPVPARNKTSIQLFPGIADIQEWMRNEYFGIEIRLNYRQTTPALIQMRLNFDVRVLGD